ncbi:MAG TPA: diphthine--ammonia ligase [Thermomicrobiaceae bacterium]|nr:diphthine--ammonia ligase [Thermomicrobiaceae bacterium]
MTRYALSWSGGKDSLLALDRARARGLKVAALFTIHEGNSGRVRFHGVRADLIRAQAEALGLPLLQAHTHPRDYETVFLEMLDQLPGLGIGGVVFGNIHLTDIRGWYEERARARGLDHVEPLWGDAPSDLLREFVARGHVARIVSVNLALGRAEWLGRAFDADLIEAIGASDVDPCGERGEYHSFSLGGPRFRHAVAVREVGTLEMEGHRILDLELAEPAASPDR